MTIARATAAVAMALLTVLTVAQAQDKRISRSVLPPAVEKAVVEQSQGATIRGFSQENENGEMFYEAEFMVHGHSKDVLMDASGTVVEVEEQIPIELLTNGKKSEIQVGPDGKTLDHEE